jgi:hypothetical protein
MEKCKIEDLKKLVGAWKTQTNLWARATTSTRETVFSTKGGTATVCSMAMAVTLKSMPSLRECTSMISTYGGK